MIAASLGITNEESDAKHSDRLSLSSLLLIDLSHRDDESGGTMIDNRKTLAGCVAIIAALNLTSCKQEKVESEKSVKIDLVCSLKFFEKGVDTGQWMDGRLITIDGDILKIDPLPSTFKIISNLEHDKQDIVFEGAHSKGQINRFNGDLMLVDGKYVSLTGKCKKAVPLF